MLVVNKSEGMKYTAVTADFYELGMGDPYVISAAHGDGVTDLVVEALDAAFAARPDEPEELEHVDHGIKIAIVGRPNVGKSTLINTLVGEERVIAFDMPGTTRDSIEVPFERDGKQLHADRHRRYPPPRQGVRSDREVLGRQDAAVDRRRQRRRAAARRPAGHLGAGRAHRRLHPRVGPRAGGGRQQVGRPADRRARRNQDRPRPQARFPVASPRRTSSRRCKAPASRN